MRPGPLRGSAQPEAGPVATTFETIAAGPAWPKRWRAGPSTLERSCPAQQPLRRVALRSGRTGGDQAAGRPLRTAARPAARSSLGLLSAAVTSYRQDAVRTMRWSIVAT